MNQLIFSEIQSNFEFGETRHDDESEKIKCEPYRVCRRLFYLS